MDRRGRGVSRGMLPLLAIHALSEYHRLPWKPPVTAGLVLTNTLIYLRPAVLHSILPFIDEVWFNPYLIVKYWDLKRFFLSPLYHVGESHLVYNMMSLLWKGIQLETSMGSAKFASMVVSLLGMSQGITLLLAKSLLLFDYEKAYYSQYAVGFSGVLFAMKVVLNSQMDNYTNVHGLLVPSRYAAWAELILIQMFVPGVSFLGHLGGILAGTLYLKLKRGYLGSDDPLSSFIQGVFKWPLRLVRSLFGRQRITGRGTVGGRQTRTGPDPIVWRCQACTFDNSGWLSVCEMCGTNRSDRAPSPDQLSSDSDVLSLDEIRRRRVERFGGQ